MRKPPKLPHVKHTKAKGTWYSYFNTGKKLDGKTIYSPMPPFDSTGFFDSYAVMLGHRNRKAEAFLSVGELVKRYERSPQFRALAQSTQITYAHGLRKLERLKNAPAGKVERRHLRHIMEKDITSEGTRNLFIRVVGALYAWAQFAELTDNKPTSGLKVTRGDPYEPWPAALLSLALASDNPRIRLAVALLYFTGQRIGDVCKMQWTDLDAGRINVCQQKTGKVLDVPLHGDLKAILDAAPRKGDTMLSTKTGRPISQVTVRKELQAFAETAGFKVVPHGLRKNAVIAMLEAGASVPEVGAITGQSFAIVEHYAKRINQRTMGDAAMLKWGNKSA